MSSDSVDHIYYRQLIRKNDIQSKVIKILESEIQTLELKLNRLSCDQTYVYGRVKTKNLEKIIKYLKKDLILLKEESEKILEGIFRKSFPYSYSENKESEYSFGLSLGCHFYSKKYEEFVKKYKDIVRLMEQKIKELTKKIDKENEKLFKREKRDMYKLEKINDDFYERIKLEKENKELLKKYKKNINRLKQISDNFKER